MGLWLRRWGIWQLWSSLPLGVRGLNPTQRSPTLGNRIRKRSSSSIWWGVFCPPGRFGPYHPREIELLLLSDRSSHQILTAREAIQPYSGHVEGSASYTQKTKEPFIFLKAFGWKPRQWLNCGVGKRKGSSTSSTQFMSLRPPVELIGLPYLFAFSRTEEWPLGIFIRSC